MGQYRILVKGIVQYMDKYLVVEKWYDDNIAEPYQWEFVDGVAEFGETPDHAVLRELYEKTHIDAEISRPLYTWGVITGEIYNLGIAYLCIAAEDEVILSDELHNYDWIDREQFEEYISNTHVLADLARAEF